MGGKLPPQDFEQLRRAIDPNRCVHEITRIARHKPFYEIRDCRRHLKIVLKVVARDPSGGQNAFSIQRAHFKSFQADIHRIVGGRAAGVSLADVVDRGQAERCDGAVERSFISRLPQAAGFICKWRAIQKYVKNNIGVKKNTH